MQPSPCRRPSAAALPPSCRSPAAEPAPRFRRHAPAQNPDPNNRRARRPNFGTAGRAMTITANHLKMSLKATQARAVAG